MQRDDDTSRLHIEETSSTLFPFFLSNAGLGPQHAHICAIQLPSQLSQRMGRLVGFCPGSTPGYCV